MTISDREAADIRTAQAVAEAHRTVQRQQAASRGAPLLGLRQGLEEAVHALREATIASYAEIDGAGEPPLRQEFIKLITDKLTAFVRSSVAGVRGGDAAAAGRVADATAASAIVGVEAAFDLAVHARTKRLAGSVPPAPKRRKQDKFGILDAPTEYATDFVPSVGVLGVSVIYFDLDDFKKLNTRFTEPVIDRTILPQLQRLIDDLAAQRGHAYAEGGDEFIVMLPNTNTSLAEAFASLLLERIRSTVFNVDGETVSVQASAGIASSLSGDDAQACREQASAAKRDAKVQGKDRYVVSPMRV